MMEIVFDIGGPSELPSLKRRRMPWEKENIGFSIGAGKPKALSKPRSILHAIMSKHFL